MKAPNYKQTGHLSLTPFRRKTLNIIDIAEINREYLDLIDFVMWAKIKKTDGFILYVSAIVT